jgi:hypothetical protein
MTRRAIDPTYDYAGAKAAGVKAGDNGHWPDTYKTPQHPTFSTESKYSKAGKIGGEWVKQGKDWLFKASEWNLRNMSREMLMDYFDKVEPGNTIEFPRGGGRYKGGSR